MAAPPPPPEGTTNGETGKCDICAFCFFWLLKETEGCRLVPLLGPSWRGVWAPGAVLGCLPFPPSLVQEQGPRRKTGVEVAVRAVVGRVGRSGMVGVHLIPLCLAFRGPPVKSPLFSSRNGSTWRGGGLATPL